MRRIDERGLDPAGDEAEAVREQLRVRDDLDRNRAVAPLRAADDAVVIETDGNTFERTVDIVEGAIRNVEHAIVPAQPPAPAKRASRRKAAVASPTDAPPAPSQLAEQAPHQVASAEVATQPAKAATPPADRPPEPEAPRRSANLERAMRLDNDLPIWMRMVALVCRIGARLFANVVVEGLENVPRTGAVILAINHVSNADAFVTGSWITPRLRTRRIHWLGKKELFDWPVFGSIASRGGDPPGRSIDGRRRGLPDRDPHPRGRRRADHLPGRHAQPRRRAPGAEGRPRRAGVADERRGSCRSGSTAATGCGRRAASSRSRSRAGRSRSASGRRSTSPTSSLPVPTAAPRRRSRPPRSWAASPRCSSPGIGARTRPRSTTSRRPGPDRAKPDPPR